MPLGFGKKMVVETDGEVRTIHEETFYAYATVKSSVMYIETVKVKDDKALLAEFLTMLDKYKAGEIDLPGIQLLRDKHTGQLRAEKTWFVPKA